MLHDLAKRFWEIKNQEGFGSALQSARSFILYKLVPQRPRTHSLVRWIYIRNRTQSDAAKNKLVYVDPSKITRETLSKMGTQLAEHGLVYMGRWDKATSDFHDRYKVRSLRRHFKEGVPWTETVYYNRIISTVREHEWRGCRSEEDFLQFLKRFDDLYTKIQNKGYKTQTELMEDDPQQTKRLNNDAERPGLNEIGVNIGRNGELLWHYGGQHRLCIAQLLELDEVPVQVYIRHHKWQNIRDQVRKTNSIEDLSQEAKKHLDHPDLIDVHPT